MNQCDEIRDRMVFYLDDELRDSELAGFEAHLAGCRSCRDAVEDERRFLESVREAHPLHTAPPELRAKVELMLSDAPPSYTAPPELRRRVSKSLWQNSAARFRPGYGRIAIGLMAIVIFAVLLIVWMATRGKGPVVNPPSEFALMAVNTHQRYLKGQLPLEIVTDSPGEISRWFAGKVPFGLELPGYQEASGQEKLYRIEGARLVGFKNDYAAYVAYQMQQRPISLVVTSASKSRPSGGEEIVSKGLTFHYDSIDGLKVMTWSDRGLTYALVSDLEERGQQSCIVCHQGTKDRGFIESLKPKHSSK
ncbi:MAG: zf-HC2 domain-containing protein [Blastocatellia bacterium]|nr:zf-HC2 domain-containing protein [Blastocatellia bacterium]